GHPVCPVGRLVHSPPRPAGPSTPGHIGPIMGPRRCSPMRARDRVRKVLIPVAAVLAAGTTAAMTAPAAGAGPAPAVQAAPGRAGPGPAVTSSLQSAWQSVLAGRGLKHALIGAYAYDVTTGRTLASIHAGWRLTPGSLTKLYASAASLADWGNRFSLVTRVAQ